MNTLEKKYEVFLLGSSSAHRFNTDDIHQSTGLSAFNYSVQHTSAEDYLAITRHILKHQRPKMILLQLDFESLNKFVKTDPRLYTSPLKDYLNPGGNELHKKDFINTDYFTLGAINDSFKVVWVNYFNKARHLYREDGNYRDEGKLEKYHRVHLNLEDQYVICKKRVEFLKEIQKICHENNVRLIVWITPYSYDSMSRIDLSKKQSAALLTYTSTLKSIFDEVYDTSHLARPEYTNANYFQNSNHPNRPMTQLVLTTIFKK